MKQVPFFGLKCVLVTLAPMVAAVAGQDQFPPVVRAVASIVGVGVGALLGYLLKTTEPTQGNDKPQ